jgi:hypothetical protein
VFVL